MIIKRNGQEVAFDKSKIFNAISKANNSVDENHKITDIQIQSITDAIENDYNDRIKRNLPPLTVETIQDIVETKLAELSFVLSKSYMIYRYERALIRSNKATDDRALAIIRNKNDEINEENANKDALLLSTQRDYLAGEKNKGLCKRYIFPEHIYKLHEEGIIHIHKQCCGKYW